MSSVLLTFENDIAHITLNRPEVRNAFNAQMIARLSDVCDEIAGRSDIRAVILRGEGQSFCAGADLGWMKESIGFTQEQNEADALALAGMLNKLNVLPQLTIARVHGAAFGGGLGLVACCDIALAGPHAVFALSEVKLGLIPATIGPYVIAAIGPRQARRYFQTGERMDAAKAHDIGLAHILAASDEEMDSLLDSLLTEISKNGSIAMRAAKKLCFDLAGLHVSGKVMDDTAQRIARIRTGEEAQTRLRKFLEK